MATPAMTTMTMRRSRPNDSPMQRSSVPTDYSAAALDPLSEGKIFKQIERARPIHPETTLRIGERKIPERARLPFGEASEHPVRRREPTVEVTVVGQDGLRG